MSRLHHFLIHDQDSSTNFLFPEIPIKKASGYSFDERDELSTKSQNSDSSDTRQYHHHHHHHQNQAATREPEKESYQQCSIRKHVREMEAAYATHQIDLAFNQAEKVNKLCGTRTKLSAQERLLIANIQREKTDVEEYQKILNQGGWEPRIEKKNIKVSSKIQGNTVGVLVEAYLDVPLEDFLGVVTEFDLMKNWMPFMESSNLEKIISRNCRIGHCINNFPILAKRESFFQGIGYDRMGHNQTVFMYTRSLNERKDLQAQFNYTVKETKDAVQLDYRYFILEFKPESPKSGNVRMAINVDMKLNVPMFLLIPATTGFGVDFYTNILEKATNFKNSQWQKSVKANPDFYNFVSRRITQFYEQK